ncbi:PREDICTED: uncharacterized protein LOC105568517 [Vollenhovia emeryi]|uniref:uncharacterized protein LOC105568517 n=1 Tax=Vollenhovia emeryi TaxID=411798 RepID=UPI0005F57D68|nr:PREDICTED: uncharacterized protein LOC105568517 [Vollenhovia emeryi]
MAGNDTLNVDEELKSERTVRKRRSLIFQARAKTCERNEGEVTINESDPTSKDEDERDAKDGAEVFNMTEYLEKLRQERKDWQEEYRNRKAQRRNLAKQKASVERLGQVVDIDAVEEDARDFISMRPNYEQISENREKMLDLMVKIYTFHRLTKKLNQRFTERIERSISKATGNMIKHSEQ